MSERYGDFISYKPPVRPSTWILWFFPPILLVVVMLSWFIRHRHQAKRSVDTHQPDEQPPLSQAEQQRLQDLLSTQSNIADKEVSKEN